MSDELPARIRTVAGPLLPPGELRIEGRYPYETIEPAREGFADNGEVKLWYAVWGERTQAETRRIRADWPGYRDAFMASIFSEPHSTKAYEDGVRYGWATDGEVIAWCLAGWRGHDVREHARRITCPTLVIHGEDDLSAFFALRSMSASRSSSSPTSSAACR